MRYPWISHFFLALLLSVASIGQDSSQRQAPGSSESSSKSHNNRAAHPQAAPDPGSLNNGIYQNRFFGFRYQPPFGWVDRTAEMAQGSDPAKSMLLLAMFERPPQARGTTVNSAVVLLAESIATYPRLKTAEDYFEPLAKFTSSKGFKVVDEPHEFFIATRRLMREDFIQDLGVLDLKMLQSTLVTLHRGYVLSFTFIGGDEEEVDNLIRGLSFASHGASGPARSHSPR